MSFLNPFSLTRHLLKGNKKPKPANSAPSVNYSLRPRIRAAAENAITDARQRRRGGGPLPQPPKEIIRPAMQAKPITIAESEASGNYKPQLSAIGQKPRGPTMPGVVNDPGYAQLPPDVAQTHPQQGVVRDYVLNGARPPNNGARPPIRRSPEEREEVSGIENPILAARRRARIPL